MEKLLNFEEFYNKYAEFRDPKTGLGCGLELLDFQKKLINSIEDKNIMFIAKSRQMYMTTLMAYYIAWKVYLAYYNNERFAVGIMTERYTMGAEFLAKVRYIISNVLDYVPERNDQKRLYVTKDIYVQVFTSFISLCGHSLDMCIFDECAYFKDLAKSIEHTQNQMKPYGKLIAYSSLTNERSYFNDLLDPSITNKPNYTGYLLHYSLNPHYTYDKLDALRKMISSNQWSVEMEITPSYQMIKKGNTSTDENLEELLQFRVSKTTKNDLMVKLFKMSEETGKLIKLSDYLRHLVENDLNK